MSEPRAVGAPLYRWVAVPLDGSDRARRAITPAQRLAALHGASLWLVTVAPAQDDDTARRILEAGRAEAGDQQVRASVLVGDDPARVLGRFDDEHPDVLLCLTTRGRGALPRALFGSVGAGVVRHSSQAVALVGPGAALEPEPPVDRLVVCLDGTAEAEVVLDWAAAWSDATGVGILLVHVVYPLPPPEAGVVPTHDEAQELAYLHRVAVRLQADGHRVIGEVVQHPHPPEPILGWARHLDTSVVCLATAGRGPLVEAVVGSVTAEVVRSSPVPVVVASRPRP